MLKNFFLRILNILIFPLRLLAKLLARLILGKQTKLDPNSLVAALKTKEVQRKLVFTIMIIVIYRVLAAVPLPGIDIKLFNEVFAANPLNNIFTLVTGGRLDYPSVVAIGLGAYINASIIMQLLQSVVPKFEELSKEGERGRNILNQYTRYLAIPLNMIQGFVIYTILKTTAEQNPELSGIISNVSTFDIITMIMALTAGSMVLMWLGELISEYGIGNGISIIITISILSVLPGLITNDFQFIQGDLNLLFNSGNLNVLVNENFMVVYITIVLLILMVVGITYVTEAVRKITIQYASRVRAAQVGKSSYLPLKINQAGVLPVIFASALLTFPQIIGQLLTSMGQQGTTLYNIGEGLLTSFLGSAYRSADINSIVAYELTYFVMIIFFSYFYTFVTFKPGDTADNLKKSGGFIPGIRPGQETKKHITSILIRLTLWGSIFLAVVAIIPSILRMLPNGSNLSILSGIGGTSLLIVVGVIVDTLRQMKSMAVTRSYEQFK